MIHADDIVLVFFDGEEAFGEWSDTNGTYGSRHLAEQMGREGTLGAHQSAHQHRHDRRQGPRHPARNHVLAAAPPTWSGRPRTTFGYGKYFLDSAQATEDDHLPFLKKGVNALDLIDFDYGPNNAYWHTPQDTMDKLSAHSFDVVGNVLIAVIRKL